MEVTFPVSSANGTEQCAEIEIVDDRALEGEHNFTVEILSTSPPISTEEPSVATVIILDNDGISDNSLILYPRTICTTVGDKKRLPYTGSTL